MNLAYRQGNSLLRLLPWEYAHLGLWCEHRALHSDGVRVRRDIVRQDQDRILATTHELACHGEDEVWVAFEHLRYKLVGRLHRDLGPLSSQRSRPAPPKCSRVLRIAHLRTPAHRLRQHGRRNPIRCSLQKTPDEWAADAETHHGELVDSQMIHEAELIVSIGFPRPIDLDRAGGLAAGRIAQICRYAPVITLELLHGIKRRVACEEGNGCVQASARKQ